MERAIGLITGSGIQDLATHLENAETTRVATPTGTTLPLTTGYYHDTTFYIFSRHGDETNRRTPSQLVREQTYEAVIKEFLKKEVEGIYATSAVGALDEHVHFPPLPLPSTLTSGREQPLANEGQGHFIIPTDYDYVVGAPGTLGTEALVPHAVMNRPFNAELSRKLRRATEKNGATVREGTYLYKQGDAFESPAMLKRIEWATRGLPHRVLGMTTIPELELAAQAGIPFTALCANVNYAGEANHERTMNVMSDIGPLTSQIFLDVMKTA